MPEEGEETSLNSALLESAASAADTAADMAVSAADAVVSAFTTPEPAMPSGASIKVAKDPLKAALKAAFKKAKNDAHGIANSGGIEAKDTADPIIEALGEALGTAIHEYFTNAWVDITMVQSVAMPGIVCETIGIPPIRPVAAGAIIMPIIPVHHALPDPVSRGFFGKLK